MTIESSRHGKRWWPLKVLSYLLLVVALGLAGLYLWRNRSSLEAAWQVPADLWCIPGVIYLGTLMAKALSFEILSRVYGVRVPLFDSLGLTASGLLSNYAAPGNVSIALRTLYLYRVLGLHYKHFLPLVLAAFAFSTGLYGVLAGVAALIHGHLPSSIYASVMLLFSGGGLVVIVLMFLPYHCLPTIGRRIEGFLAGWRLLHGSRTLFSLWLGSIFLLAMLEVAFLYSIFRLLAIELTLAQTAIILLAKECAVFLRITPGAFGIAEGAQLFFATQFDADPASILLAAIIARGIELVWLGLLSLAFVRRLGDRLEAGREPIEP
jgi:Lysylphosphatidylglycerol synthase TM region